ncbi:hypothetical protein BGW80DRAFT_293727 [Lactifluus volemus]|nr:hypothetical protein BGW80DRAFT_293727 [Lactifluus volemus]
MSCILKWRHEAWQQSCWLVLLLSVHNAQDNVYAKGDSRLGAMFNFLFALDPSSPLALFIREDSPEADALCQVTLTYSWRFHRFHSGCITCCPGQSLSRHSLSK